MKRAWFTWVCAVSVACGGATAGGGARPSSISSEDGGSATDDAANSADGTPSVASDDATANTNGAFVITADGGPIVVDDAGADAALVTLEGVTISPDGRANGVINGYAWVSLAPGATGTTRRGIRQLCIQGTIAAVTCTPNMAVLGDACNWSSNWGVDLGFNTTNPRSPWGSAAPSMLAVSYSGTPGTYNLLAHVAGDPDSQWYGLPNYASGQFVSANALTLQYWNAPPSTALTAFQNVDMLALFLDAEPTNVTYDFCLTGISAR